MKSRTKIAYGDFQTPRELSTEVASFLRHLGIQAETVVEPTCGRGSFLGAAAKAFGSHSSIYGFDINPVYVSDAFSHFGKSCVAIQCEDFFAKDWRTFFKSVKKPILVLGNPPWVTSATLGSLESTNLPKKSNFQGHTGFSARTGKANFDISEWMLLKLVEALRGLPSTIAMLCKTTTARRVLHHCWRHDQVSVDSAIHAIDAKKHFDVSVDACLFILSPREVSDSRQARVYSDLSTRRRLATIGMAGGELVADVEAYSEVQNIDGIEYIRWRSGLKHDASRVMEFECAGDSLENGLGEGVDLEEEYLFPLLKSSDLANNRLVPRKKVIVTQFNIADSTAGIQQVAPKTWNYLEAHSATLDGRKSSIYSKRPRFSVFGVGGYTFSPWKVCISGLYKNLAFRLVGPYKSKPVILDDTCYFLAFEEEERARFFYQVLSSDIARRFIHSVVFYDAKRPITIDVLRRLDLRKLSSALGLEAAARHYLSEHEYKTEGQRQFVFDRVHPAAAQPRNSQE